MRLTARIETRLDARLEFHAARPLALALSGGGDSLALLRLAAGWAARRGRRLLALTVDHGLSPDSGAWTRRAEAMARAAGADWRGLVWMGPYPATGLPAAARRARHALIADAARAVGARVVLMAHTQDDAAEADWMRARGSTLGALRDWAPSPAWPQGRGLVLMRPLLDVGRAELRAWLGAQGLAAGRDWIEDPANADPRFQRSLARAALAGVVPPPGPAPWRPSPVPPVDAGEIVRLDRDAPPRVLAAALVAAGGGDAPPRGERLARLADRLRSGERFTATLGGARLEAEGEAARLFRDAGRIDAAPLRLAPGQAAVWDGRFEIVAAGPGLAVAPARGRLARLADHDRAALSSLPPAARAAQPVLIRDDGAVTGLAEGLTRTPDIKARGLVGERLALALAPPSHERDLGLSEGSAAGNGHDGVRATKPLSAWVTPGAGRSAADQRSRTI